MSTNWSRVLCAILLVTSLATLVVYVFVQCGAVRTPWRHAELTAPSPPTSRPSDVQKGGGIARSAVWEGGPCERRFVGRYKHYCEQALLPHTSNVLAEYVNLSTTELSKYMCPCVPTHLRGSSSLQDQAGNLSDIDHVTDELTSGGHWQPASCVARHRVAILVPYRRRERDLLTLLKVLHRVLRRQMLDYTIFVVEQVGPRLFNRGALLNVGYTVSRTFGRYDCLMLHDVDMVPKNDLNFYTCSSTPRHVGKFRDHRIYRYKHYFGGVVAISPQHFARVNGFSNHFYGWGGEDDDFRQRSRGRMLGPRTYRREGLSNLQYRLVSVTEMTLYINISVVLPPPND